MTLPAPNLDDRRQDDIFAEARQLIAVYAPEWTDWNESDPGIALLQLFAWMTDQTLFRLNQVPDRLYIKFLELLGMKLIPANPATTELTFTLVDPPSPAVMIPKGTRIAASPLGDDAPPVFETQRAIEALGAPLQAVRSFDGSRYRDHTAEAVDPAGSFTPFGPGMREGSALLIGFGVAPPIPDLELNLLIGVPAAGGGDPPAVRCIGEGRRIPPPATIVWEGWNGQGWEQIALNEDETLAFSRSGYVRLVVRGGRLAPLQLTGDTEQRRWIRGRLEQSGYQHTPLLSLIRTNSVPAIQAQQVEGEILGGSSGLPDQTFQLGSTQVVPGSLSVEIDEGSGFVPWTQVPDFYGQPAQARVYTLDEASGTITFGGRGRARPPVANAANPVGNVIARRYQFGGGPAGNVPAGFVTDLMSPVDGLESVTNLYPAVGGRATEPIAEAKLRAPALLASANRAVTKSDFEYFALTAPGATIGRAIAQAEAHPDYPGIRVPGAVTVVVIPDALSPAEAAARDERPDPAPQPTEATLRAVCAHLDTRRLLTTEVHVSGPRYRDVRIESDVVVDPSADLGAVRGAIDAALDSYFHPLWGGEAGTGWPLGGTIFYSLVYRAILNAHPGAARVDGVTILLDERAGPFCADVEIGEDELLRADGHTITVRYET